MRRRLCSYLAHNAVGFVALFVALGGSAWALSALPVNSVGTKQLKNGAVTAAKVKSGSLGADDLSGAAQAALKGAAGVQGVQGIQGNPGVQGNPGIQGTPGTPAAGPVMGGTSSPMSGGEQWIAASGLSQASSSSSGGESIASPNATITASDLYVHVDVAPTTGESWEFDLEVNGSDSSLACTITAGHNSCSTPASTVVTIDGPEALVFDVFGAGGPSATNAEFGWRAAEN